MQEAHISRDGARAAMEGDYQGAIADFDQAFKLKPDFGEAYCN